MNVILYAAMSVNGMIAKGDDDTQWISKEEWDSYRVMVCNAGCLVVGRRTYGILTQQPEFVELKQAKLVVVSHEAVKTTEAEHVVAHSPKEALEKLKEFKEVIVAGGGILNASFLAENLVDEIYLDIEPILLGQGIPLFRKQTFEQNLELVGWKNITANEIQLHYRVAKPLETALLA